MAPWSAGNGPPRAGIVQSETLWHTTAVATHELKTNSPMFSAIVEGSKTFELRLNDRGFAVGDTLLLREYCSGITLPGFVGPGYTGREVSVRVTYMLEGGPWLTKGHVAMGIVLTGESR